MLHTRIVRFDVIATVALFEKFFLQLNTGLHVVTYQVTAQDIHRSITQISCVHLLPQG